MSEILVNPSIKIVEKLVDRVIISVVTITLGVSCVVRAELYNENNNYPEMIETYLLIGDEYLAWSNDDNYIVEYVLNKLNLNKRESLEVPPNTPN